MLVLKMAERFYQLVAWVEKLVELYNRNLAGGLDRLAALAPEGNYQKSDEPFYLDESALEKLSGKPAKLQIAHLVDMAKVEALDTMGED